MMIDALVRACSSEVHLRALHRHALNLFHALFFLPRTLAQDAQRSATQSLDTVRRTLQGALGDYHEFLVTVARNNVPFTSYPWLI